MKKGNVIAAICLILVAAVSLLYFFVFDKEKEEREAQAEKVVKISAVKEDSSDGVKTNKMSFENTSLTLDVTIDHPGASIVYNVTVNNSSNRDVTLKSINGLEVANEMEPKDFIYEVSELELDDTLKARDSIEFKVKATWNTDNSTLESVTKKSTISFVFE